MDLEINLEKEQHRDEELGTAADYYLLDRDLCVINGDKFEENAENTTPYTSFFDVVPAKRAVREEISAYVRSFPGEVLLTLCGRTPVLFIGTLVAHTGLVLAVLPKGAVKATLAFPGAFHRVPAHVLVSASAQMRYKQHHDTAFAEACRWLVRVSAPFLSLSDAQRDLRAVLSFAALRLSNLWDLPFACDLSGLPALSCGRFEVALGIGVMLAALVAAKRTGAEEGVRLCAAMEGAPILYLEYTRRETVMTVPEFSPLLACSVSRGVSLDVVCPLGDSYRIQVRASLGIAELSAQGVRERHRFLAGKSPLAVLPQTVAAPLPFKKLLLD